MAGSDCDRLVGLLCVLVSLEVPIPQSAVYASFSDFNGNCKKLGTQMAPVFSHCVYNPILATTDFFFLLIVFSMNS